jgi:hypothetical protein
VKGPARDYRRFYWARNGAGAFNFTADPQIAIGKVIGLPGEDDLTFEIPRVVKKQRKNKNESSDTLSINPARADRRGGRRRKRALVEKGALVPVRKGH